MLWLSHGHLVEWHATNPWELGGGNCHICELGGTFPHLCWNTGSTSWSRWTNFPSAPTSHSPSSSRGFSYWRCTPFLLQDLRSGICGKHHLAHIYNNLILLLASLWLAVGSTQQGFPGPIRGRMSTWHRSLSHSACGCHSHWWHIPVRIWNICGKKTLNC